MTSVWCWRACYDTGRRRPAVFLHHGIGQQLTRRWPGWPLSKHHQTLTKAQVCLQLQPISGWYLVPEKFCFLIMQWSIAAAIWMILKPSRALICNSGPKFHPTLNRNMASNILDSNKYILLAMYNSSRNVAIWVCSVRVVVHHSTFRSSLEWPWPWPYFYKVHHWVSVTFPWWHLICLWLARDYTT